jgi:NADPH-dependent glutamate synthase beta subunit-like oxidoreductase
MGRICSHPCETACNRAHHDGALAINALERFVGDWGLRHGRPAPPPIRREGHIAVVGGGPAGLACAYHLARLGYQVAVYEAMPELGGLLRYGIPEYRLPRGVLDREIELVLSLGITVHAGTRLGHTIAWEALDSYHAVFLAVGASCPVRLGIAEEESQGVYAGLTFLREVNSGQCPPLGKRGVVVGGGSTAMDVARTARRLGAEVIVVSLEARQAMPAVAEEIEQALAEDIRIINEVGVEKILVREGKVAGVKIRPARLSFTESGAVKPIFTEGNAVLIGAEALLLALGQLADLALLPPGLEMERGFVTVADGGASSQPRLYAGGDLAPGPRSVAHAVGSGTRAARAIHRLLSGQDSASSSLPDAEGHSGRAVSFSEINLASFPRGARARWRECDPIERVASFVEVVQGFVDAQARAEARRCFSCGTCTGCDTCLIVCPDVAIRRLDSGLRPTYQVLAEYCKGCGLCASECPRGALVMVPER